jgi:methanogenic corrinoid protein MtbC1
VAKDQTVAESASKNTYNMKVVLQETGVKPDTLRAWERRYGLPAPQRSKGGHRLYSRHDIDMVQWLLARQGEGLSISRAISLWRSIEETGSDPLIEEPYRSASGLYVGEHLIGSELDDLKTAWVDACLDFDEQLAEGIISQAFAQYPMEIVCSQIFQMGLADIGDLWYHGEITVQQEHFASSLADRRLKSLIAGASPPTSSKRVIVACPPGEEHSFSSLFITLVLRRAGWDVIYLGANVPIAHLKETIDQLHPDLIILTAMQLITAASLLEMADFLSEQGSLLAYGGRIFNMQSDLQQRIPGSFLGEHLASVHGAVERILLSKSPMPEVMQNGNQIHAAREAFLKSRGRIEVDLTQHLRRWFREPGYIPTANNFFSRNLNAALAFGDLDLLELELQWTNGLLHHHNVQDQDLERYLTTYLEILSKHLDVQGKPILDWVGSMIENLRAASPR